MYSLLVITLILGFIQGEDYNNIWCFSL